MSKVPRQRPADTHLDAGTRADRGAELLDMVRQWTYSRVTRRAHLNSHAANCTPCRRRAASSTFPPYCSAGRELAGKVAECDRQLEDLRRRLAELDAEQPAPPAAGQLELGV